jgi:hypothetical protein
MRWGAGKDFSSTRSFLDQFGRLWFEYRWATENALSVYIYDEVKMSAWVVRFRYQN